jgi:hypothetical protein
LEACSAFLSIPGRERIQLLVINAMNVRHFLLVPYS